MGSSFGKVRKYNLNSVDSTLKYNMVSEEEMKHSSTSPVPADNNELFSRERPSLRNRVGRSNQRLTVPQEAEGSFGTVLQAPIIPEYYNLRAREETILPQQTIKSSNIVIDDGDYITLKEAIAEAPNPPPRPPKYETEPPPLPPRNKILFNRPDSSPIRHDLGINSNPKPNQKIYSAEDLNKLLKPLNKQNSIRGKPVTKNYTSQHNNHHHYPNIPERHSEAYIRPGGNYSGTPLCDCQRYKSIRAYHNEYHSPPPYNYMGFIQDTGQPIHHHSQVYYPPPKYYYDEPNPPQYHSVSRERPTLNTTHRKYNTISLDRDIQTHNWHGYRPPTFGTHHTEQPTGTTVQDPQKGVNHQKSHKTSSHEEDKIQNSRHERTPLHHSDILSQPEYMSEVPVYRSLRAPSCYTIPEEGSWLPQFQYNPVLHHLHHRGYHH